MLEMFVGQTGEDLGLGSAGRAVQRLFVGEGNAFGVGLAAVARDLRGFAALSVTLSVCWGSGVRAVSVAYSR